MKNNSVGRHDLFIYLLWLTGIFSLLEISFVVQGGGVYLADFEYVSDHLQIPLTVLPGIFFYLFAQLLVHVAFTVLVWGVARLVGAALHWPWRRIEIAGFTFWVIGLVSVLVVNEHLFPNSKFAELTAIFVPVASAGPLSWVLIFFCAALLAVAAVQLICSRKLFAITLPALGLITWLVLPQLSQTAPVIDAATANRPNIILIGVDSLRPDFVNAKLTPTIQAFIAQGTVFSAAYTTLARTFPAWVSLLTGEYPKNNGVRFDLADQSSLDFSDSLPAILKAHGYETIYAIDETRFSNIG